MNRTSTVNSRLLKVYPNAILVVIDGPYEPAPLRPRSSKLVPALWHAGREPRVASGAINPERCLRCRTGFVVS
jgi:hypothetical protein